MHAEILVMLPAFDAAAATTALVECMHTTYQGVPILAEADEPTLAWADAA